MIRRFACIAAILAASYQGVASADTLKVTGFNPSDITVMNVSTNGGASYEWQVPGKVDALLNGVPFNTYCTEIDQLINQGDDYTDFSLVANGSLHGFTTGQADMIGKLFSYAYGANNPNGTNITAAVDSMALQLAVWEILYETQVGTLGYDLSTGDVLAEDVTGIPEIPVIPGVVAAANDYLAQASSLTTSLYDAQRLFSPTAQDQLLLTAVSAVPEPGTVAMMGLGLMLLGYRRQRA